MFMPYFRRRNAAVQPRFASIAAVGHVAVLREILTAYAVTATGPDVPKVRNITSVPRRGARVRVG